MSPIAWTAEQGRRLREHARASLVVPPPDFPIIVVQNRYRSSNGDSGKLWVAVAGAVSDTELSPYAEWFDNRITHVAGSIGDERDVAVAFWADPPPYIATDDDPTTAVALLRQKLAEVLERAGGGTSGIEFFAGLPLWYLQPGDSRWKEEPA